MRSCGTRAELVVCGRAAMPDAPPSLFIFAVLAAVLRSGFRDTEPRRNVQERNVLGAKRPGGGRNVLLLPPCRRVTMAPYSQPDSRGALRKGMTNIPIIKTYIKTSKKLLEQFLFSFLANTTHNINSRKFSLPGHLFNGK